MSILHNWFDCLKHVVVSARSKHTDESFHMCEFTDDPPPLSGKIRSKEMKVLLRKYLLLIYYTHRRNSIITVIVVVI